MLLRESVVRSLLLCTLVMTALRSETCRSTREGFKLLNLIKMNVPEWDSETLVYTPTMEHYESCPGSTMICVKLEMSMLLKAWNITNRKIQNILRIIQALTPEPAQNQTQSSSCVPCEQFPEEPVESFLTAVNITFQRIKSQCAAGPAHN